MKHKNRYIFSGLFVLISIIVVFAINLLFNYEQKEVVASHKNELKAIATLKTRQLADWYADELNDSETIVHNVYLIQRIKNWLERTDETNTEILSGRIEGLKSEHGYYSIGFFSPDFKKVISTKNFSKSEYPITDEEIKHLVKQKTTNSSGFYKCPISNKIIIDFYAPVFDDENKKLGYMVFRHDPELNIFPLIVTWPVPSRSSETLIVRKEGDHVIFLNDLRHIEDASLGLKVPLSQTSLPAVFAALGGEGFVEGVDYRGVDVLAWAGPVAGTPWYLVAKTDIDEIVGETFYNAENQVITTIFLLLALLGVMALFYSVSQKNFYKKLYEAHEEFRITLYSIGDGVITTDSEGKVVRMNPVAEQLTGWPEKKAAGKDVGLVFNIVNEQTYKVVESPVAKVMKQGRIVGLANHTVLLARDGRKIPIADSGAPIFDENGKITGIVLVFRDQTEERENQKKLMESERKLSMLFSNLPGMAYRCKNDRNWTMEFISSGCVGLTGYASEELEENRSKAYNDLIVTTDREYVWDEIQKSLAVKKGYTLEYRITTKSGKIKWVWEKGRGIFDDRGELLALEGLISDINERKLYEDALKASENLFQTLTNHATVGIFRTDSKGRTTYVNPMWSRLSGMSSFEAQDMKWTIAIHPEDREAVIDGWNEAFKNQKESFTEYRFIHPDGKIVWVSGHAVPQFNAGGDLVGYIGTISDITPQKTALRMLKESEEKYRLIIQNQSELVIKIDAENRYQFVSKSYCELFGKTEAELIGKSFMPLVHEDDKQSTANEMKKLFVPPYTCYLEQRAFTTKGWRWLSWSDKAVLDENNQVVSVIGVGRDIHEKKLAEERVKSLSKIVEETQDEIYVFDRETFKFIYLNQSAMSNLGYSSDEILQMAPYDIKPEFTLKEFETILKPLTEGEKANIGFETIHQRKDGTKYPVEAHLQIVEYEGRKAVCAFIRDITQRKDAADQIIKSKLLLRTIIDNLPDAIYMKDAEGKKLIANKTDVENCGVDSEEELLGKDDFEFFPPEMAQHFWGDDLTVLKKGIPVINREEKLTNRFGQTKMLLSSKVPLKDANGHIIGLVGVGRDITREKKAETEAIKLAKAVSQSPVSIIITNPGGVVEYVNPKFSEVTGYTNDEVIGKNPRILKSGHHDKPFYKEMWKKLEAGKDWSGEILNRKKNGELFWESAIISPILDDQGEILYYVGIKEDITEKKKMMEELVRAKERAEESDQLKSSFLANMSHEIRTPLNSILGFSNFLVSEEDLSKEEKDEFSGIINKSADSLLQIINDIIDISSLETGQLQLFPGTHEVSPVIKSLHTVFSRKKLEMGKADIEIEIETKPGVKVYADENRLIQIFTNLLNNSLKFTEKGKIIFGIESADDTFVNMFVSDTGIGIKKEHQQAVFERFRQSENNKTRSKGGNGLGLSIVKNLVELMGGEIWLESEEGKGSVFRFALPAR